nr:hypothetical protein [Bhargavaea massiliensis]
MLHIPFENLDVIKKSGFRLMWRLNSGKWC